LLTITFRLAINNPEGLIGPELPALSPQTLPQYLSTSSSPKWPNLQLPGYFAVCLPR